MVLDTDAELARLRERARLAELEALRERVARRHNLPDLLADRLEGETEADLEEDAAMLAGLLQRAPPPRRGLLGRLTGGRDQGA
jgi:inactivated superfamily I helicase